MKLQKIYLLNAPILTAFGEFRFESLTLEEARKLVSESIEKGVPVESAIGHAATAEILSELLGCEVRMNRQEIQQSAGEAALIFRLKKRIPEGKVLTRCEIEEIGYELGLLTRII